MTTPDPFAPGYRLTDGNQLNYEVANPSWSVSGPVTATAGGTMATSTKVTFTITNVTAAAVPGAGITLPQALPGRILIVVNDTLNDIRIFAEGGSTVSGIDGQIGLLLRAGIAGIFTAVETKQWQMLEIISVAPPIYQTLVGYLYSDGVNPITGVTPIPWTDIPTVPDSKLPIIPVNKLPPEIPVTNLPLTVDQSRDALLNFGGTDGTTSPTWISIVENDLAINHNDSQDATAIRYWGAFWPVGGPAWTYVRTVLKAYFSWSDATADARILAAQTYAYTNR